MNFSLLSILTVHMYLCILTKYVHKPTFEVIKIIKLKYAMVFSIQNFICKKLDYAYKTSICQPMSFDGSLIELCTFLQVYLKINLKRGAGKTSSVFLSLTRGPLVSCYKKKTGLSDEFQGSPPSRDYNTVKSGLSS